MVRLVHQKRKRTRQNMKLVVGFYLLMAIVVVVFVKSAESTICAPLSFFKVDGTVCRCSTTGKEYTCRELAIQKPARDNDFFHVNDDDDDDTYVLYTRPQRRQITNDHFPSVQNQQQQQDWYDDDDFDDSQEINSFEDFNRKFHDEK